MVTMNPVTCVSLLKNKIKATVEKYKPCKQESTSWSPVYDIMNAGPRNRFTIKTNSGHLLVHNCGYGGGVGAVHTFSTAFNIDLSDMATHIVPTVPKDILKEADSFYDWMDGKDQDDAKAKAKKAGTPDLWPEYYEAKRTHLLPKNTHVALESLKRLWRREHKATVAFWKDADTAIRSALATENTNFYFGKCYARRTRKWVRVVLPSGHAICYPGMKVLEDNQIVFKGVDQFTKKWGDIKTLGAKIVENAVQAFSRDIFKYGQLSAAAEGYDLVLPVHDELVTEVPDTKEFTVHRLEQIMATVPPWAEGIPLAAEGFESSRYRK